MTAPQSTAPSASRGDAPEADRVAKLKADLRRSFRAKRRAVSAARRSRNAEAVAEALAPCICAADTVAVYAAQDGELDLAPLIARCRALGAVVALPVVADAGMSFAVFRGDETLRLNRHRIPEPAAPEPARPTLVLAPLVAFDDCGRRLGMGGGYYDRYFLTHPAVARVGVAHECQRADALPSAPGDAPLPAVVTECGWRWFASQALAPGSG